MKPHRMGRTLFTEQQIQKRVLALSNEICATGQTGHPVFTGILCGSFMFMADLARCLSRNRLKPRIDFITLSSYGSETVSKGTVEIVQNSTVNIQDRDVIIVDDILDSGRTLAFTKQLFLERGARSVRTCVLLDKKTDRVKDIHPDFTGFSVENVFAAGYGLDYAGYYRDLPYITEIVFL